jgi:hypothetical protein
MSEVSEDPRERSEKYIEALSKALGNLIVKGGDRVVSASNISRVADSIQRYLADARHYLSQGRPTTSLTSIAYAEGLLDALTFLELAQLKDPQ